MKVSLENIDNYEPKRGANYFSLKDDGDKASVRFMYETVDDVDAHNCHKVKLANGYEQWVECLREYNDPEENCPLCAAHDKSKLIFWIPVYNLDKNEAELWQRGWKFWKEQLSTLMMEKGQPFCGNTFIIERHGIKGDQETTYDIIHTDTDDTTLDDFDEVPTPVGTILQEKTFEELQNFVNTGNFTNLPTANVVRRNVAGTNDNTPGISRRGTSRPDMI